MSPEQAEAVFVLIADDQRLVRTGFRVILASEPGIDVVGEAANGVEAVDLARSLQPDVVLMDIRMPLLDGLEATRKVLAGSRSRVLILTTFDSDAYVYDALRAVGRVLMKLSLRDRAQAVIFAYETGLVIADPDGSGPTHQGNPAGPRTPG